MAALGTDLLSTYVFCHYNYAYDCLRPTLDEIVQAYQALYGGNAHNSDADASSSDEEADEEEEAAGEEGGEAEEADDE